MDGSFSQDGQTKLTISTMLLMIVIDESSVDTTYQNSSWGSHGSLFQIVQQALW